MKTSTKKCSDCHQEQPSESFYTKGFSKSTGKPYHEAYCKKCSVARVKQRQPTTEMMTEKQRDNKRARVRKWANNARVDPDKRPIIIAKECRARDKKKGRVSDITKEVAADLISQSCVYCGSTERISIDRIDNSLGYVTGNMNPACLRCNLVRGDMPYQAWLMVAPAMRAAYEAGEFDCWSPGRL
jgi:hypothetical protein